MHTFLMVQKSNLDLIKRNLQNEFSILGSTVLTSPTVVSAASLAPPAVPQPVAPVHVQEAAPPAPPWTGDMLGLHQHQGGLMPGQ